MQAVRSGGDLTLVGGSEPLAKDYVCPDGCVCFQIYNGSDDYRLFYLGQELKSIEQDKLYFPELSHA
jgi:hypothetical protein